MNISGKFYKFQTKPIENLLKKRLLRQIMEADRKVQSKDICVRVLHQCDNFLVVDKPYDFVLNSDEPDRPNLYSNLAKRFPDLVDPTKKHHFAVAHRLDFSTSGVLAIPLNKEADVLASKAFENRKVIKYYLAIVRGHLKSPTSASEVIKVSIKIGTDTRPEWQNLRMSVSGDPNCSEKTRPSLTRIAILSRGTFLGEPATKILLKPVTGRRHQLRLHCHYLGHRIVGDFVYSDRTDCDTPRMYLHSYKLNLPTKLVNLDICAGDPFDSIEEYCESEVLHDLKAERPEDILS